MSSYPPDRWEVRFLGDMDSFTVPSKAGVHNRGDKLSLAILMAAPPAEGLDGSFRLSLGGTQLLSIRCNAAEVIPHPGFMDFEIRADFQPGMTVVLPSNAIASDWLDLKELIQAQDVDVHDSDGEEANEQFLALLASTGEGASWRWLVASTGKEGSPLALRLQSLPIPLATLEANLAFKADSTPAMALGQFAILTDNFGSPECVGPVPVLFSSNPGETAATLAKDKRLEHNLCQAVYSRLIQPEVLSAAEALAFLKAPRTGRFLKPLVRSIKGRKPKSSVADTGKLKNQFLKLKYFGKNDLKEKTCCRLLESDCNTVPKNNMHYFAPPADGQQAGSSREQQDNSQPNTPASNSGGGSQHQEHAPTGSQAGSFTTPKYSVDNKYILSCVPPLHTQKLHVKLRRPANELLNASIADSTWGKYQSAWNNFLSYITEHDIRLKWPIDAVTVRGYVVWCLAVKKLQPSTTKSYLSAISFAHILKGVDSENFATDKFITAYLNGAKNLNQNDCTTKDKRRAMSLAILKILGHRIANSNWDEVAKQVVWAACVTGFFTSARMGEILARQVGKYDPTSDLCWKDVKLGKTSALLHLKSPKNRKVGSEFLDLFEISNESFCPVSSLKFLKFYQIKHGIFDAQKPVFMFKSGKFLTVDTLNKTLDCLTNDLCDKSFDKISCHSFRAAIPTALDKRPDIANTCDIRNWGRWGSGCYTSYTKLNTEQKKCMFGKIIQILQENINN